MIKEARTNEIIEELGKLGLEAVAETYVKNGIEKDVLVIRTDKHFSPILYLDQYEGTPKEAAAEMAKVFREHTEDVPFDVEQLYDPDYVREHIYVGLQQRSNADIIKAESGLSGIDKYLYVRIGIGCANLSEGLLLSSGLSAEEAWEAAERNSRKETVINGISELIGFPCEGEDLMYVISNKAHHRGSSAILDKEAIRAYFGAGREFYAFPSSIHEFVLVPKDKVQDDRGLEEFSGMVREINSNEVEPEDKLSDQAYEIAV